MENDEIYREIISRSKTRRTLIPNNFVLGYNRWTKGGRLLAKALGLHLFDRDQNIPLPPTDGSKIGFVINWGVARSGVRTDPVLERISQSVQKVVNSFEAVTKCSNKGLFFKAMQGASDGPRIPEVTFEISQATSWGESGIEVLGRKNHGSSGKDVAFFKENPEGFLSSDLWLQYKKKKQEFRVHIFNGEVIIIQQKVLPKKAPDGQDIPKDLVDFRIRTHRTGFIFQKNDIKVPPDVLEQAKKAFAVMAKHGLTFGAIDVIYNKSEDKAYVLEINTAPGIEESSVTAYADAFRSFLGLPKPA